uniref:Rhodanese domain-containing protein n=1 Tax=Ciona savignyi TaxID=51511 RepID=H2ZA57_CIOSA
MKMEQDMYVSCDNLRNKLYRNDDVLLLDCRQNEEYRYEHINGAHNIVLPQLMMRRLKANKLSLKSLVPPNFRQEKETFLKKCTTSHVVLYDHFTADLNNNDTTMLALLYNRMKNEGCNVSVLKGGYSKFLVDHPDFCLKAGNTGSSDADDEDGGSDDSAASSPRGGRCSPLSPLTINAPPTQHYLHIERHTEPTQRVREGREVQVQTDPNHRSLEPESIPVLPRLHCVYRRSAIKQLRSAGPLSSWHQSLSDRHGCLLDAEATVVTQRRVRLRQTKKEQRLAELQLHGTAP